MSVVEPVTVFDKLVIIPASIVVVPAEANVVTRPVPLTVAIVGSVVVQVANDVIFCVVVFVRSDINNVAVAVNWWVVPMAMNGLAGVTAIDSGSAI